MEYCMSTRRVFVKSLSIGGIGLFFRGTPNKLVAALPGGTLDPLTVPKYKMPLLIPPVMPKAGTITGPGGGVTDYYEISVEQFSQQILPDGLPKTTVWGYGALSTDARRGLLLHNAPSLTIEADWKKPVRVKWINKLVDAKGNYLPHLLPVDSTLHWANPPGGAIGRDTRPVVRSTPPAYKGPVPIVTHLHGAVGVGDESDGYAEAWYLPAANNIPAGYATVGTWHEFFRQKAGTKFGSAWGAGYAIFQYPNENRASTLWYHDHALGMTRLNVYAGPAGFYIVRGGPAGDKAVLDSRTGLPAVLPGPAPKANDMFPPNKTYYEFPVAIQDRSFNADGSLFYPDSREFFDGVDGPFLPDTDLSPIWNPEFFGNTIMVNGNTWPFHTVEKRRYRIRFLNGCQSRFLILDFGGIPGVRVWQIGNEGGFLSAPVNVTAGSKNRLLMGLAERADLIVDFTNVPVGNYVLQNVGPDEPFGGGEPAGDFDTADPKTTGQILQFRVVAALAADPTTPPQFLQLPAITPLPLETKTRRLALLENMSMYFEDSPAEAMLGTVVGDPSVTPSKCEHRMWMDGVTENPIVGATELWEIYNATADAHPMHIHEVVFQVVDRQNILVDELQNTNGMTKTVQIAPGSQARPPQPSERGFKDTVIAYPGEVTRLRMQFTTPGQFVWHCHIVEHEDNEMMRPYRIGDLQPGQP
jgi:FtsP/CotA-like multicopper oxidase with cupredoxin domain